MLHQWFHTLMVFAVAGVFVQSRQSPPFRHVFSNEQRGDQEAAGPSSWDLVDEDPGERRLQLAAPPGELRKTGNDRFEAKDYDIWMQRYGPPTYELSLSIITRWHY